MKYTKEELKQAVKQSKSIAQVCKILNIYPGGGNYKTLKIKFKKWDINIDHFTGQGWNIGLGFKPNPGKPLKEILIENSNYTNINSLRKRLINEEIFVDECFICGIKEWNNKSITMELDHINGINNDHRIENLRLLCPNCHSQTDTHRGRNIGRLRRNL